MNFFWNLVYHTELPISIALQWRHNERNGVSNDRCPDVLLNHLFRHKSTKHKRSASLAFVMGIHRSPVNSAHNGPVTRKMFPFDDVIIGWHNAQASQRLHCDPKCFRNCQHQRRDVYNGKCLLTSEVCMHITTISAWYVPNYGITR